MLRNNNGTFNNCPALFCTVFLTNPVISIHLSEFLKKIFLKLMHFMCFTYWHRPKILQVHRHPKDVCLHMQIIYNTSKHGKKLKEYLQWILKDSFFPFCGSPFKLNHHLIINYSKAMRFQWRWKFSPTESGWQERRFLDFSAGLHWS